MSFQLSVVGKTWTGIALALAAGAVTGIVSVRHARPRAAVAPVVAPSGAVVEPPVDDVPPPPPSRRDTVVKDVLAPLSPRALFQKWLAADHLLERLAATIVDIAADESPNRQLPIPAPRQGFSVTGAGSSLAISEWSYARYDFFANVIASLDERKVAAAYRTLHPLLEGGYHLLGYPGKPLDPVAAGALRRIADAPVRDEVRVRRTGTLYVFEDPALEALGPVEKQLLRMGPRNTRLLKDAAREIAAAAGLNLRAGPELIGAR